MLKHTVDEIPPFGLKPTAKMLWGIDELSEKEELDKSIKENGGKKGEVWKADTEIIAKYCMQDCALTMRLMQHYLPKLKQEGLEKFFFEEEVMPLYKNVTRHLQSGGIPLDIPLLKKTKEEIEKDISELEDSIQKDIKFYTDKEFKKWFLNKEFPESTSGALGKEVALYAALPLKLNKDGFPTLNKKALEACGDNRFALYLLEQPQGFLHEEEKESIQRVLFKRTGQKYMFNLSSKHHLKKLFFDHMKETPISRTDKGAPQVDELFLSKVSEKYGWVKQLQIYNKLNKILGTYINRFLDEQEDGIFYPDFLQHGTISGRYSGDIQQLNRPIPDDGSLVAKYNNIVRKFFISGNGHVFIDTDYESLEPHVFAHVSGDENIKNIFRNGLDFYSDVAIRTEKLKGVSSDKKAENYLGKINKQIRQKAKEYSLGIPYGKSAYALSFSLNVSKEEAEVLWNDYFNAFPELKNWYDNSAEQIKANGFIKSETGRIRHMPEAKDIFIKYGDEIQDSLELWKKYSETDKYVEMKEIRKRYINYINNARNFQIQSLSASIVNRASIKIMSVIKEKGLDARICAQVHDQIIVRCKEEDAIVLKDLIQDIMENTYKLSINLKAPPAISKDFYEGH